MQQRVGVYEHRRYVEGKEAAALKNDFKAIRYLAAYRGIPLELFPKRLPIFEKPRKILRPPEDIHRLLHAKYALNWRNSYEHHLVIALLVIRFGFGIRAPSQFPWFYPYLGRHWCANARPIDSDRNHSKVADWLGDTSVTTLRPHYEHNAEIHKEICGGDWLERAFQPRGKWARTTDPRKNGSSPAKSP